MNAIIKYLRAENDPEIVKTGPSSLTAADKLGKGLGWLGLAAGAAQLFAARRIAESLGLEGKQGLLRLFGARDVGVAMMTLSPDRRIGLWSRVGGDIMNVMLAATAIGATHPRQRRNAQYVLAATVGIALLDVIAARAVSVQQSRTGRPRNFGNRSGYPQGVGSGTRRCKRFHHPTRYACRVCRGALGWRGNNGVEPHGQ